MKNVSFDLGKAVGLVSRQLTITRFRRASDAAGAVIAAYYDTDVGAVEEITVPLPDNTLWQAVLVDTRTSGEVSEGDVYNFNTGYLQFPGPLRASRGERLLILSMEDLSSSSSSSSPSSNSSSSSSPSSASSESSSSSSESSSSSSSVSTSSESTSSESSSESSESSISTSSVSSESSISTSSESSSPSSESSVSGG